MQEEMEETLFPIYRAMKQMRFLYFLAFCLLFPLYASSQKVTKLKKWNVPSGHYSGITALEENLYAVVSDKSEHTGFHLWYILLSPDKGKVEKVQYKGFYGDEALSARDEEGIAYCPELNTIFLSGEADQRILEYRMDGSLTGKELHVPTLFGKDKIQANRGFEALCYDKDRKVFWTSTESPLKEDKPRQLRLQCFSIDLQPAAQYNYYLDTPQVKRKGKDYYHGLVALAALPDGKLLCLEREANITPRYLGSKCWCKLFSWDPQSGRKTLLDSWKTRFALGRRNFADYEGMCLGPQLSDGRQTLLLVNDSQGGYGRGAIRLRDYLRVFVF